MSERRRIAIEFFPIRFRDKRLHMFVQGRPGKWCQDLKQRGRATQVDRIVDGGIDAFDCIRQETEHVKAFRSYSLVPAMADDLPLMVGWNRPPADALQSSWVHGFHPERNRIKTRAVQQIQEFFVDIVETCFAFESHLEILTKNTFCNADCTFTFFGE